MTNPHCFFSPDIGPLSAVPLTAFDGQKRQNGWPSVGFRLDHFVWNGFHIEEGLLMSIQGFLIIGKHFAVQMYILLLFFFIFAGVPSYYHPLPLLIWRRPSLWWLIGSPSWLSPTLLHWQTSIQLRRE